MSVSFQIAGGETRAVQAASTDHKAFDQREGTFSTLALNVKTLDRLQFSHGVENAIAKAELDLELHIIAPRQRFA